MLLCLASVHLAKLACFAGAIAQTLPYTTSGRADVASPLQLSKRGA